MIAMNTLGYRVRIGKGLVALQAVNIMGERHQSIMGFSAIAFLARRQEYLSVSICCISPRNDSVRVPINGPSRKGWEDP